MLLCRSVLNYFPGSESGAGSAEVEILDGRTADLPGWEVCGFQLIEHPSAVVDWGDDAEVAIVHYPEIAALARDLTGCDHALVSNHIKRNPEQAAHHYDLAPITLVHSDFAESYGDRLVERYRSGGEDPADQMLIESAKRLLILQFWRNLGPARMDLPLAFCDGRTVSRADIRPFPVTDYAGSGFDFEALGVAAPEDQASHAWYAFHGMIPDEVVAFRTYDSALVADGLPYWTPHSAFRDPEIPLGQPSRSSIELRATCLFL